MNSFRSGFTWQESSVGLMAPQEKPVRARVQQRSDALLQATVDLVHNILRRVCRPVFAGLLHSHWNFHALDIMWPLDEVQVESLGKMPSDAAYVSVEVSIRSTIRLTGNGRARLQDCCCRTGIPCSQREPDCVCHDAENLSATRREGRCFWTDLRILRIHDGPIPRLHATVKHIHIMAMQMHRMGRGVVVGDDDASRCVSTYIHRVPIWVDWTFQVLLLGQEQKRIVVVSAETVSIHVVELMTSLIEVLVDCQIVSRGWLRKLHSVVWNRRLEWLLEAGVSFSASFERDIID